MNFAKMQNPYDFAHPVIEPGLFAGREKELEEVRYYLDQATMVTRPFNLALMGERASGKTSLLNMIQVEAESRGLYVIRVNLDEADAEYQLPFFCKLMDSILQKACSEGAYGGLIGKTYDTYRDMTDAYEIPEDKIHCPFSFPIQYAKAMSKGNISASVSDTAIQQDIQNIQKELGKTLVILFDECDVLTKNKVLLQKLRNINMSTTRFMLVFTGTPALFPMMDDVFSPIIRQFKKVRIGPFTEEGETEDCIRKPLEKIGVNHPVEIFDIETYFDVREIHDLSGGRPYEIQLLCHYLFRRIQEGRAKRMVLSLDVLDEVRRELETTQDVNSRPMLAIVRNLDNARLRALDVLCRCNRFATFEQIWFAEYISFANERWSRDYLTEHLKALEAADVVSVQDDVIRFLGDDFDRIYCKYFARTREVRLSIDDMPYELSLGLTLDAYVARTSTGLKPLFFASIERSAPLLHQMQQFADRITNEKESNPFESDSFAAERLYQLNIDYQHESSIQVYATTLYAPQTTVTNVYYYENNGGATMPSLGGIQSAVADISRRASELSGDLEIEVIDLPLFPIEQLFALVQKAGNERIKIAVADMHESEMNSQYLDASNPREALYHGERSYSLHKNQRMANNLGYLYLITEQLDKAFLTLREARNGEDKFLHSMAMYNLGIVEAKQGNFVQAQEYITACVADAETLAENARLCACLIIPNAVLDAHELRFDEVRDPDLLEAAKEARDAINSILEVRSE